MTRYMPLLLFLAAGTPTGLGSILKSHMALRGGSMNEQGINDGFFYSYWSDQLSEATYTNGPRGEFRIEWGPGGNLVGGKGWNVDVNDRVINFFGEHRFEGNSTLALYGWTRNPLVEYYVVENWGEYDYSDEGETLGTLDVDGSVYDITVIPQVERPSIDGTASFEQYRSVRRSKRTSGTIDFGAHVRAWEALGMGLGKGKNHIYQIMACEGLNSTGSCTISASDVTIAPLPTKSV